MRSSLRGAVGAFGALVSALTVFVPGSSTAANDRSLPMRFDLRLQGPVESCGTSCKILISASGSITGESGRDFARFIKGQNIKNATVVLDSDGGSVLGAIALGREIRKAAFDTTVGRTVDIKSTTNSDLRATLSPRADCESMCAFVMLGGVQRTVPAEARVMVHQIWLGDRREDPTAATYSAEDMVLVQRDIGRLAQFTAEMGASMDLLDLSLRIPPWEPLHSMTRDEIRRTKLVTDDVTETPATIAVSPPITAPAQVAPVTSGVRATPISGQRWSMTDRNGSASLVRQHPLTVEGDTIGTFDLVLTCGADNDSFEVNYLERRSGSDSVALPKKIDSVKVRTNAGHAKLAVGASERQTDRDELVSYAAATVPASLVREFADKGNRSMVIETASNGIVTMIRIGNTGARQNLPQLVAACTKSPGARADLPARKTGGLASAQ